MNRGTSDVTANLFVASRCQTAIPRCQVRQKTRELQKRASLENKTNVPVADSNLHWLIANFEHACELWIDDGSPHTVNINHLREEGEKRRLKYRQRECKQDRRTWTAQFS